MSGKTLSSHLIDLLTKPNAHATVKDAIQGINLQLANKRPAETNFHSVWEEFEHMRIAQEDILRYTLDKNWQSPEWPQEYWRGNDKFTEEKWNTSVKKFFSDLDEVIALINNKEIDLVSGIPHGEGRTYLRQVLLIADHNAYHTGQIIAVRKLLGDWKS